MDQSEHIRDNNAHFQKMAPKYHLLEVVVGTMRKRVVDIVGAAPQKILDVACGPGAQSYALAQAGHSVVGIDVSPDMLAYAQKDPMLDLTYIEGDATIMPWRDSQFDVSTISFALHDMPKHIALAVLGEMKRVTKSDGRIIIVDYHEPSNVMTNMFLNIARFWETPHYVNFIKRGLHAYISAAGMRLFSKRIYFWGLVQCVVIVNTK